ncbi:GELS1-like protein [Mya arenaria]|uniref:GELS1-like protein n=1 Tax=Mya arenaria TaxID=6604 RepID=A0ABY7FXK7_MYAAR|nr:GELS1-like protein [Mya arenaria]
MFTSLVTSSNIYFSPQAAKAVAQIKSDRGRDIELVVLEEADTEPDDAFYGFLDEEGDDDEDDADPEGPPTLLKLSDADGSLDMQEDVFIVDTKKEVFVWVGKGASIDERRNGITYAHKAKKYDWKDSNMALFGSDTEKAVKKESAESEPAWAGSGEEPGVRVWRIEKFEVKDWPKEEYGNFYSGDSYIILNVSTD